MPISAPTDIAGCKVWLAADRQAGASDGDLIATASNGGSLADWTAAGAARPTYKAGITPTGKPVFRFDGAATALSGPDLSALAAGTVFRLSKLVTDPPATDPKTGFWVMGTAGAATHHPYTDGNIYEGCGTNSRRTVGDPTPSLSAAFRVYEVVSGSGDYRVYLDGSLLFSDAANTVAFPAAPFLGKSNGGGSDFWLDGDDAAFLVYDSVLSVSDRAAVLDYLTTRYVTGGGAAVGSLFWWDQYGKVASRV